MSRKHANYYSSTVATTTVAAGDLALDVASVAGLSLSAGQYVKLTLTDSLTAPTKTEIIKVTGISGVALTIERAQEGSTAQTWAAGDFIECRATEESFDNPDGVTFNDPRYKTYIAPSSSFNTDNGPSQVRTATANETIEVSMADADTSILKVKYIPGAHTIAIGTSIDKWAGAVPGPLAAEHHFLFWSDDDGATVTGCSIGEVV